MIRGVAALAVVLAWAVVLGWALGRAIFLAGYEAGQYAKNVWKNANVKGNNFCAKMQLF